MCQPRSWKFIPVRFVNQKAYPMDGRRSRGRSNLVSRQCPWSMRASVIAWVLVLILPGCAATRHHEDRITPELLAQRSELSRAAQDAMDRSDWPAAQQALERLISIIPRSAEAYQRLGQALQAQGNYLGAEKAYLKALELDHDYPAALIGLGETEAYLGRLQAALKRLDEAVVRGRVLENLGRTDESLAAYFRALEFEPNSVPATISVVKLQIDRGQSDQALARIDQAIQQLPTDPEARHQRGRALLALGQSREALPDLKLAAETLVDRPEIFLDLARALSSVSPPQKQEALEAARRAEALAPGWADARDLSERLTR